LVLPERMRRVIHRTAHYGYTTLGHYSYGGAMRIARALTIKVTLPLMVAGATLLSGVAIAVPSIAASVNSATVVASGTSPNMYHGSSPNMYHG
jgi:hypothetical protein